MQKERAEKMNNDIRSAILISQMSDHEGFNVFIDYLDSKIKEIRFQDVMGLKDDKVIHTQQGIVIGFEDIKQFLLDQKVLALRPMINPDTGEEEVLSNK